MSKGNKVFSTNDAGTIVHPHEKKMNLDIDFTYLIKINSDWVTDLNVKHKSIKLYKII